MQYRKSPARIRKPQIVLRGNRRFPRQPCRSRWQTPASQVLIDNMLNGYALLEVIRDINGNPVDYIFRQVNPAFERIACVTANSVDDRLHSAVFTDEHQQPWRDFFHQVVMTGEPDTRVIYSSPTERYVEASAFYIKPNSLCLTFVDVNERITNEIELKRRLTVEHALVDVSGILLSNKDADINTVLRLLGNAVNANRSYIFLFRDDCKYMDNVYEWCAPGIKPEINYLQGCLTEDAPWWMEHIKANKSIIIPDVSSMPPKATAEQQVLQMQGIRSLIVVPMCSEDLAIGYLGFDDTLGPREWSVEDEYLLRTASGLITSYFDRQASNHTLQVREEQYELLADNVHDVIWKADMNNNIAFVSPSVTQMSGYSVEEAMTLSVMDCLTPESQIAAQEALSDVLNQESQRHLPQTLVLEEIRKDGSTFWAEIKASIIWGQNDEPVAIVGVTRDITERIRATEALGQSESKFRSVFDASLDALVIADDDGNYVDVNPAACELLGYTKDQMLKLRVHDIVDSAIDYTSTWTTFTKQGRMRGDIRLVAADGSSREVEFHAVRDITPGYHLSSMRDVSERKEAEASIRLHSHAINAANDQIIITSAEGRVEFANFAYLHKKQCIPNEVVGGILDIAQHHPTIWNDVLAGNVWRGEIVSKDTSNQTCIEDSTITPIRDDAGDVKHIIVIKRDITERKMTERHYSSLISSIPGIVYRVSLRSSPALQIISKGTTDLLGWDTEDLAEINLDQMLEMIAPEDRNNLHSLFSKMSTGGSYRLNLRIRAKDGDYRHIETLGSIHIGFDGEWETIEGIAFDVTEQVREQELLNQSRRMEALGKLSAGIAHDFNNLLQAVLGYTGLLSNNRCLNDAARLDLLEVERASLRAADLVRQILTYSKQVPQKMMPVSLADIVAESVGLLKETFPRSIRIGTSIEPKLPLIMADSSQIYEVLVNLTINARDAMPDGGKLVISVDKATLTEEFVSKQRWGRPGEFIRCMVTDTGSGMDKNTKDKAFEPFFTTKQPHEGTGLGLSLCYGVIQAHNGFITIDSEPGRGTSISFFLPITSAKTECRDENYSNSSLHGRETILIVDDEEYIRQFTQRLLESYGYRVILAENGRKAVEILSTETRNVDLVVLDLNMPEMDGLSTLAAIRDISNQTKVLVLTGMDTNIPPGNIQPDFTLMKPCKPKILLETIRNLCNQYQ